MSLSINKVEEMSLKCLEFLVEHKMQIQVQVNTNYDLRLLLFENPQKNGIYP